MAPPTQVYSTDVEIQVTWNSLSGALAGNSAILSYNLYWDNGTGATNIELVDANQTTYTVSSLTGGLNYKFKVRARNIYGYGNFSSEFIVAATDFPGKPPIAIVASTSTNVTVTWVAPSSHFAVIDSYQILFRSSN